MPVDRGACYSGVHIVPQPQGLEGSEALGIFQARIQGLPHIGRSRITRGRAIARRPGTKPMHHWNQPPAAPSGKARSVASEWAGTARLRRLLSMPRNPINVPGFRTGAIKPTKARAAEPTIMEPGLRYIALNVSNAAHIHKHECVQTHPTAINTLQYFLNPVPNQSEY